MAYPDPRPYPFCRSSSRRSTIIPAQKSCERKKKPGDTGDCTEKAYIESTCCKHTPLSFINDTLIPFLDSEYDITWMMMSKQIPGPRSDGSPYIPVITYTTACPIVIIIPNTTTQRENPNVSYTSSTVCFHFIQCKSADNNKLVQKIDCVRCI